MSRLRSSIAPVVSLSAVLAVSCTPYQQYHHQPADGPERRLQPVKAQVVMPDDLAARSLRSEPLSIGFGADTDGTALLDDFLARADAAGARWITGLTLVLHADRDDRAFECRTEIVPETVEVTEHHPAKHEWVMEPKRVTREVSELEHQCETVTRYQFVTRTESEYGCEYVTKPVHKTRTVYDTEYDYTTRTSKRVSRTEFYTDYERSNECKLRPVTRTVSERVPERECKYVTVTRTVTRYEHQLEHRYVPARLETIERQRLRELAPVCDDVGPAGQAPGAGDPNRLEGTLHFPRR